MFTINDPQAIGTDLAAKQLSRSEHRHHLGRRRARHRGRAQGSGDTADPGLRLPGPVRHGAARRQVGYDILNGKKPASTVDLLPSKLITRDNVAEYKGWTSDRSQ